MAPCNRLDHTPTGRAGRRILGKDRRQRKRLHATTCTGCDRPRIFTGLVRHLVATQHVDTAELAQFFDGFSHNLMHLYATTGQVDERQVRHLHRCGGHGICHRAQRVRSLRTSNGALFLALKRGLAHKIKEIDWKIRIAQPRIGHGGRQLLGEHALHGIRGERQLQTCTVRGPRCLARTGRRDHRVRGPEFALAT